MFGMEKGHCPSSSGFSSGLVLCCRHCSEKPQISYAQQVDGSGWCVLCHGKRLAYRHMASFWNQHVDPDLCVLVGPICWPGTITLCWVMDRPAFRSCASLPGFWFLSLVPDCSCCCLLFLHRNWLSSAPLRTSSNRRTDTAQAASSSWTSCCGLDTPFRSFFPLILVTIQLALADRLRTCCT